MLVLPSSSRADTSFFTPSPLSPSPPAYSQGTAKKKQTISVVSRRSFLPHFLSSRIRRRDRRLLSAREEVSRQGEEQPNSVSHEFREATRIGVEPLHIGRRFPTLRQYGQVPPVILRLFAPRRVAALYVGTYIRTYAALTEYRDRARLRCKKRPRGILAVAPDFRARTPSAKRSLGDCDISRPLLIRRSDRKRGISKLNQHSTIREHERSLKKIYTPVYKLKIDYLYPREILNRNWKYIAGNSQKMRYLPIYMGNLCKQG